MFLAVALLGCLAPLTSCGELSGRLSEPPASTPPVWTPPAAESPHLVLGNPSGATQDALDTENLLIVGRGSAISYNAQRGTANWVSWKTTEEDLGESIPRPIFRSDPRLPPGVERVEYHHYSGSGYDRGHLVPSADRFADAELNAETFYMTNIVPQKAALNRYPWERLESYVRRQVRSGNDAYNIAGCYGELERLRRLSVPTNCWKIVLLLPKGSPPLNISKASRVIAVDMPNSDNIGNRDWKHFRVTVREIEQRTGFDFLSALPPETQDRVETVLDSK